MQVLKPEIYNDILLNAYDLIANDGLSFKMADLAKKCNVTPGNLYRYFENKAAIINEITRPAIEDINTIVQKVTLNKLSFNNTDFNDFYLNIDMLAKDLTYIYFKHGLSLEILAQDLSVRKSVLKWLDSVLTNGYNLKGVEQSSVLAEMTSQAILRGVLIAFSEQKNMDLTSKQLETVLATFLNQMLTDF